MTVRDMHYIECHGAPRESGRQYGEQAREAIRVNEATWAGAERTRRAAPFLGALRRYLRETAPELLEEMVGVAEGCGLDPDSILLMNSVDTFGDEWIEECTPVGLSDSPQGPLACKNNDGSPTSEYAYVVRKTRPDKGLPVLQVTYAGLLSGLDAMNAEGLANTHGSVGSVFDKSGRRLDVRLRLYQLLRTCRTTREFIEGLTSGPGLTGKGFNILVMDRGGDAAVVEAAVPLIAWRRSSEAFIYSTNHYLAAPLEHADTRTPDGRRTSVYRLGYLDWRAEVDPPTDLAEMQALLASHEPWAPCRHAGPHVSVTEWSMIALPRAGRVLLAPGPPCETEYASYDV